MLDEYNRPVRMKNGRLSIGKGAGPTDPNDDKEGEVVIEVKETLPEILGEEGEGAALVAGEVVGEQEQQKILAVEAMTEGGAATISTPEGQDVEGSQQQQEQEQQQQLPTEEGQEKPQQPEPAEASVPNPDDENQKPISRAERRRLIKEEIQRLAQGEQPVYYQRRLW